MGEQFARTMSRSAFPVQDEQPDLSLRSAWQSRPQDLTSQQAGAADGGVFTLPFQDSLLHESQKTDPENRSFNRETTEAVHVSTPFTKSFSTEWRLSQHLSHGDSKQHPSDASGESSAQMRDLSGHRMIRSETKLYRRTECSKAFSDRKNLKQNVPIHSGQKPLSSDIRPKVFSGEKSLKRDMLTVEKKKSHSCPICEKAFSRKEHLRTHMRTHSGDRPYSCSTCLKAFSQQSHLNTHMRTHSGARPYSCPVCEKAFSQQSNLNTHMRTHSGARPYSCPVCEKAFSQQSNLNTHMRTHFGKRLYSCSTCFRAFTLKPHLKRHLRTHCGAEPARLPCLYKVFHSESSPEQTHADTLRGETPLSNFLIELLSEDPPDETLLDALRTESALVEKLCLQL